MAWSRILESFQFRWRQLVTTDITYNQIMTWLNAICMQFARTDHNSLFAIEMCFHLWHANAVNNQSSNTLSTVPKRGPFFTVSWFACFETKNAHTRSIIQAWILLHGSMKRTRNANEATHSNGVSCEAKILLFGWQEFSATIVYTAFKPIQIHQRCHKFATIKGVNVAGSLCDWIECCEMKYGIHLYTAEWMCP